MLHALRRLFGAAERKIWLSLSGSVTTFLRSDGTEASLDDVGLPYIIDGGGAVIATGEKAGYIRIPHDGHIVGWTLYGDDDIVIDTWKDTYGNFPPTVADTIWGGTEPELSGVVKAEATGLSIAVTKGDVLRHNVVSAAATEATLNYHFTRS